MDILIQYITSPSLNGWILILKTILIVFSLLFLTGIVLFLSRSSWLKISFLLDIFEFFTYRPFGVKKIIKAWNKIMARLETGLESEYKLAVIEADSMLDDTLKRMGYGGETLGERLGKLTSATLPNIEEVKKAHQTRNDVIHDPDYRLSLDEARKVLAIHEQAFKDLQAF